jgi:hypothetical protein
VSESVAEREHQLKLELAWEAFQRLTQQLDSDPALVPDRAEARRQRHAISTSPNPSSQRPRIGNRVAAPRATIGPSHISKAGLSKTEFEREINGLLRLREHVAATLRPAVEAILKFANAYRALHQRIGPNYNRRVELRRRLGLDEYQHRQSRGDNPERMVTRVRT